MKKILASLLFVIASTACYSQEISLPTPVVDSIILDLHDLKHLRVKAAKQDSVLLVYEKELEDRRVELVEARVTIQQYKELVKRLDIKEKNQEEAVKKLDRRVKWLRTLHTLRTIGEIAAVAALLLI